MTSSGSVERLEVSVNSSSEMVAAEIRDPRQDTVTLFGQLTGAQSEDLVRDAWSIGLRALANANAQAQETRLHEVGTALLADVDRQLRAHVDAQHQTISAVLGKFFDPKDGQVMRRLAAFVDDQGILARLLDKYLAPQNSVLAQTLARQVGENSPLFRRLSPTESDGLLKTLEAQLRLVMNEEHDGIVRALDPLEEDGAVARFLRSLRDELKTADQDRAKQLAGALAALNANDENSLINRLVRETDRARQTVLNAVNPAAPESAMAIMQATLTGLLKEHALTQTEMLHAQQLRQDQFEKAVREALARIETRRSQQQCSPRGGFDFEGAVVEFVAAATRGGSCILEATGHTAGVIDRCRKGDAVLRFTRESAFDGANIVFEAKRDATYSPQKALDELDSARRNRGAVAGVFVMARSHALASFPRFARHGSNVLVTWDDQDSSTDPYLHAAVLLGMALVTRGGAVGDTRDIHALKEIDARIEDEVSRLAKMEKHNQSIRKNSDDLGEEIRKAHKALDVLIRDARSVLRALSIDLHDEDTERTTPIALPDSSLLAATSAISELSRAAGGPEGSEAEPDK